MTDPHDWFAGLSAAVDVVVSGTPNGPEPQEFDMGRHVPVHFCASDIFWKAQHSQVPAQVGRLRARSCEHGSAERGDSPGEFAESFVSACGVGSRGLG
jgi:hypothetical protein